MRLEDLADLERRDVVTFTHVWRWRTCADPNRPKSLAHRITHPLAHRADQRCRVFARGANGNVGVEFEDGYRVVAPRHAIRRRSA